MNTQTIQIALTQLALLVFSTMVLVSQTKPSVLLAIILTLGLSFSIAAALAVLMQYYNKKIEDLKPQHATLGPHIGGVICYMVILIFVMDKFH